MTEADGGPPPGGEFDLESRLHSIVVDLGGLVAEFSLDRDLGDVTPEQRERLAVIADTGLRYLFDLGAEPARRRRGAATEEMMSGEPFDYTQIVFDFDDPESLREAMMLAEQATVIHIEGEEFDISECSKARRALYGVMASRPGYVYTTAELEKLLVNRTSDLSKRSGISAMRRDVLGDPDSPDYKALHDNITAERLPGSQHLSIAFVGSSRESDKAGRYIKANGWGGLDSAPDGQAPFDTSLLSEQDIEPDIEQNEFELLGRAVDISTFTPRHVGPLRYLLTNRRLILHADVRRLYIGVKDEVQRIYVNELIKLIQGHALLDEAFTITKEPGDQNRELGFVDASEDSATDA